MAFPPKFYRWRPHPWHGLEPGPNPPRVVHAYIEITPFDAVKYEIDKATRYLRVDRPQRSTSQPPTLYGFIPRTYCGSRVARLLPGAERGDADPLDICVLSERPIHRGDLVVDARVVGGIQLLDGGEADDKIVAVLENDSLWGDIQDLSVLPPILVERLRHYFGTYKLIPGTPSRCEVRETYGREQAWNVITAAMADYQDEYGS